eukprot:jgi/Ulvmu1/10105/UM006_0055.1
MLDTSAILTLALACTAHALPASAATAQRTQQLATVAQTLGAAGGHRALRFIPKTPKTLPGDGKEGEDDLDDDDVEEDDLDDDDVEDMVQCTTTTTELEVTVERSGEVHSDAITKAFATACSEGNEVNMKMFEDIFMKEDALAFAKATAAAMITCESSDEDAYHCASVTASATAYAEATAEAHASAVSTAVSSCGCMTDAVAVAVATSDIYVNLVAEASATATASVCISGEGRVSAAAYDTCSSLVFGKMLCSGHRSRMFLLDSACQQSGLVGIPLTTSRVQCSANAMWQLSSILTAALAAAGAACASAAPAQRAQQLSVAGTTGGGGIAAGVNARRRLQFYRRERTPPPPVIDHEYEYDYGDAGADDGQKPGGDDGGGETKEDMEELVECTTHTTEVEVGIEKNGEIHAEAITKAFKLACTEGSEVTMKMFEEVFLEEDAFAFAHATAVAMITCESSDEDAYHCASVTASATAYAEATAEAHASAVSTAVSSCGCMTDAVAVAVASSAIYVNLIAEATATATASVCIKGEGKVSAVAYDSCSSLVFGKVFARAVSEAIVKGDCMNSEAIARVLTEAGADFNSYSTCGMTAEAIIM